MTKQRWLINLALLVIVTILTTLVIFEPGLDKPVELPNLVDIDTHKIQSIRIERPDKEAIVLHREAGGDWQLITPLELPANTFHINRLLSMLTSRHYKVLDSQQLKLADLKLDPPLARVGFDQVTLAFGDTNPLDESQRYLQIGEKVYLLTDSAYSLLVDDAAKFVSLSPLGNTPKLTDLTLPDSHLVATETGWSLVTPPPDDRDASTDGLNTLIDNWERAQAISVQRYQGGTPQGQIVVTLRGQSTPLSLAIIERKPEFILARLDKGVQYHLSTIQVDKLLYLPPKRPPDATATPSTVGDVPSGISGDNEEVLEVPVEETTSEDEEP